MMNFLHVKNKAHVFTYSLYLMGNAISEFLKSQNLYTGVEHGIFQRPKAYTTIRTSLCSCFTQGLSIEEELGIFINFQAYIEKEAWNFSKSQRSSEFFQGLEHIWWQLAHGLSIEEELGIFPSPIDPTQEKSSKFFQVPGELESFPKSPGLYGWEDPWVSL